MTILPDHLRPELGVVFCGTAAGRVSAARGHYYSGPGNMFWQYLHEAGLTPVRLRPEDDQKLCDYGCGLTDLAKGVAASSDRGLRSQYDVAALVEKLRRHRPRWVAFHGKEAAKAVARHLKQPAAVQLGRQRWRVADSAVFVVPSASGANRDPARLEGKRDRLEWFFDLARLVKADSA